MGDHSSMGPGSIIAGGASIGDSAAILAGGVVKHGVRMGAHCVALTGAVIMSDCEPGGVMEGNPAMEKGRRSPGDRYL